MTASLEKHSGRIKIRINDELLDPVSFRYFRPRNVITAGFEEWRKSAVRYMYFRISLSKCRGVAKRLFTRITENAPRFTKTDKKIADYILKNPERAALMPVNVLAEKSGASPSAVIRFIKKLNYKNANEFRADLSKKSANIPREKQSLIIQPDDSTETMMDKIAEIVSESTAKTLELNKERSFAQGIKRLVEADCIYILGIGASGIVAYDFHQKLARINKKSFYIADSNMQVAVSVHAGPRDAVVAFSCSGRTREVNLATKQAKGNNAFCIAVTSTVPSPLSKIADLVLTFPDRESEVRIGAIYSRYAQFVIADILFIGIARHNFDEMERSLVKTRRIVNQLNNRR